MFRILCFFVLAVLHGVKGQTCIPEPVEGLQLNVNATLLWQPSTNCEDTTYIIYISYNNALEHIYQSVEPYLDVSLLPSCELHMFIVVPISDTIVGEGRSITTTMPAEPAANLTVTHIEANQQGENGVLIEWELNEQFAHCVQYFRVVRWDGETLPIDTYTTANYAFVDNLTPCTTFEFTITPIYNNEMEGGIGLVEYVTSPKADPAPVLEYVRPGPTFADMTWGLPAYTANRCPITALVVDGSYINLTVPITDSRSRPPVQVHLSPLASDSMYVIYVSLVNSAGASKPVPIGIQTQAES